MAQFSYSDYTSLVERSQNANSNVKVGFFKLSDDGDEALVRINCSSVNELDFASVHTISAGGKWLKVSCLNPLGSYEASCGLCSANAAGNTAISKASKKVYVQMLAAYKDKTTGSWSAPVPVIWERPAGFSKEIASMLKDYGNLKEVLLKVTRNGAKGDMKTTYSLAYAIPTVFKPEMVPADFSAFANFKINKHSYWEKTEEEINEFLRTGSFPEKEAPAAAATTPATTPATPATAAPAAPATPTPEVAPVTAVKTEAKPVTETPAAKPVTETPKPAAGFSGFSF